ncbi:MAG: glutaredoxin [Gammaproteobacteria bacterium]|nr:MAG: glutaredoxin [Gammaproteobacteria bacterium]RTZ76879.1 MAG: glutaredoxin [Gammaproteobacteria bacterium]
MLKVEVFTSPGCSKCAHARKVLKALVEKLGGERIHWREVNILEELDYAVELGVLAAPAIAIDGDLVFTGMPRPAKLREYLLERLGEDSA